MTKVADDLKFGLTSENAFFSAYNMGKVSRNLGVIGYKNTDIIPLWFEKINEKLENRGRTTMVAGPSFDTAVYGGMKNFTPRHYVY
jgi:hypothetical protein